MDIFTRRLAMGAAGAAGGGDPTYVDDVFSTHLYDGNANNSIVVSNGIKLGNANAGSSVYFNTHGSLVVPTSADFKFGTGAFTVEFFIYFIYSTDYISIFDGRPVGTNGNQTTMNMYAGGQLNWYDLTNNTAVISPTGSTAVATNAWTHVAYVREGTGTNQAKLYLNGSLAATGTDPQDYAVDQLNRIGGQPWAPGIGNFYISNYRVVKGTAVYTSNFTTPTEPLTDISGTVLLCCQSSTDPFAAAVTPGTITIGAQGQATVPDAVSFGFETANDGAGGMVWVKSRQSENHALGDTVRGTGKVLLSNTTAANSSIAQSYLSFNNGGFTVGDDWIVNRTDQYDYSSWTFRKQKGFFDIVTWSGNNQQGRTIPHNLGSIPGCIMVKRTDTTDSWQVYHRGNVTGDQNAAHYWLNLDQATPRTNNNTRWYNTEPTATGFTVGNNSGVNATGGEYIAYLWAGGASDEAGSARSIDFDNNDYLSLAATTDLNLTGDFTIEFWVFPRSQSTSRQTIMQTGTWGSQYAVCQISNQTQSGLESKAQLWDYDMNSSYAIAYSNNDVVQGVWTHVAFTRQSGTIRVFLNGILDKTFTGLNDSIEFGHTTALIGNHSNSWYLDGTLSNFRIVNGTAVYTSSFKPPTKGLTNITNTKLLCCNKNTPTGSTVTPGTITSHNNPQSILSTPFDDPKGFKFGADGDQNIVKCGQYLGNANDDGPLVEVGFEPQWIMIKNTGANESWHMMDCMRGIVTRRGASNSNTGNDAKLWANASDAENSLNDSISLTPTGFKVVNSNADLNGSGQIMIFIAIRRSDGYVGKPAVAGTDVFTMVKGNNSSTIPAYVSNFVVDGAFHREPGQNSSNWLMSSRMTGINYLVPNLTNSESDVSSFVFDSNNGWVKSYSSSYQSWMWKRHAGFDVVTYKGNGLANHVISHSLNQAPDMIWIKAREEVLGWMCGHSGLNGGVNPWHWYFYLNYPWASTDSPSWNDQAPTSTHFSLNGQNHGHNNANKDYIAYLWSNVEGISKCGYYTGNGSTQTITTNFQPRYLWLMKDDGNGSRLIFDTLRGWTSGNDKQIRIDSPDAETTIDIGGPTATGFTLTSDASWNENTKKFIYYAHA